MSTYSSIVTLSSLLLVPPPQLTLSITPSTTPLYESTAVNLNCSASLDSSVDIPVTMSSFWIGPSGDQLPKSNSRTSVVNMLQSPTYHSVLSFNPVDDVDSGDYQCNMSVTSSSNSRVLSSSNSFNGTLNITGETQCTSIEHSQVNY